ncbi:uncharacterized protein LOC141649741 [Silene latifolia]|uniref:uncharacterized protein LOC141649741 n=1 Tax=Silene latifolia TaxID=37657 RepID=UPI003D77ADC2
MPDSANSATGDEYSNPYDDPLFLSNLDFPSMSLVNTPFTGKNFLNWSREVLMGVGAKNKQGFLDGTTVMPSLTSSRTNILSMDPLLSINKAYSLVQQIESQKSFSKLVNAQMDSSAMAVNRNKDGAWNDGASGSQPKKGKCLCDSFNKSGHTRATCFILHPEQREQYNAHFSNASANNVNKEDNPLAAGCDSHTVYGINSTSDDFSKVEVDPKIFAAIYQQMLQYKQQGHVASDYAAVNFAGTSIVTNDFASMFHSSHNIWIIDSGPTDHMSSALELFTNKKMLCKPIRASLPDGTRKVVNITGDVHINKHLVLYDVFYLSDFKHNLLSVGKLLSTNDHSISFDVDSCAIQDRQHKVNVAVGIREGGLYKLKSQKDHSTWQHSSLQVNQTIKDFLIQVQTQFGLNVKIVRSDNGTEIVQRACDRLFLDKGIIHQKSAPGCPQRNGRVERKHRHLVETARALLLYVNLPKRFWRECLLAATHIINKLPSLVLSWQIPTELLLKKATTYDELRVIGCMCFALSPGHSRDKFDPKARKCIMLGYPFQQKAYKLYDIESQKIIISRDVIFHESIMPYKVAASPPQQILPQNSHLPCAEEDSNPIISQVQTINSSPVHSSPNHITSNQSFSVEHFSTPHLNDIPAANNDVPPRTSTRNVQIPARLKDFVCPILPHKTVTPDSVTADSSTSFSAHQVFLSSSKTPLIPEPTSYSQG